jgi:hypothetical protein
MFDTIVVTTRDSLLKAIQTGQSHNILVNGVITDLPSISLRPGQWLKGGTADAHLAFSAGEDGLKLTSDNCVDSLCLSTLQKKHAIFNDTAAASMGTLQLRHLSVSGRVQILARDQVRAGHVEIEGVDIIAADSRSEIERPRGYGVEVLQGAFTLWNMQAEEGVDITANITGLSAGRYGRPVLGSGVFLAGADTVGGKLLVQCLETGAVYSNGMIEEGTRDQIAGGVFTVSGAHVAEVRNRGPVTTYGANDMALDNWGVVDRWTASERITTHGASGIGFVNFGVLGALKLKSPIETFGRGARGFNVYSGSVGVADFDRIVTHGDGAVGIQIGARVGRLVVRRGIETFGGTGPSLVKGVMRELSAIGLSIKPGGAVRAINVTGGITTHGSGIPPVEQQGEVESFRVSDGWSALSSIEDQRVRY